MNGEDVSAWTQFIQLLFSNLGVPGTIGVISGVFVFAVAWKLYSDWRSDQWIREFKKEKEQTIQRLASQERGWRIYYFMRDLDLSKGQAERLILENDFADPKDARENLERKRRAGNGRRKRGK